MLAGALQGNLLSNADAIIGSIECAINDPVKFSILASSDPWSNVSITDKFVAIDNTAICQVILKLYGIELDIRIANYVLDNIKSNGHAISITTKRGLVFAIDHSRLQKFQKIGLLYTACLGRPAIIERCKRLVQRIIVRSKDGEENTGTGFLGTTDYNEVYLFTCNHVVYDKNFSPRSIISIDGSVSPSDLGPPCSFERIDVCAFPVARAPADVLTFQMGDILDEVLTAGYPQVRMRESNPLLFHTGHLNGWTDSINPWDRVGIISAAVAPGSSGGPVLSRIGGVLGIVDQNISIEYEGGFSSYNAMVPMHVLTSEMRERKFR